MVIVTFNTQKLKDNFNQFLEQHYKEVNVVLVQEPYWEYIKHVTFITNKEGDEYEGNIMHHQFIFLDSYKDSKVLTCVNKCISHMAPRINLKVIKHGDVHCIEMYTITLINMLPNRKS